MHPRRAITYRLLKIALIFGIVLSPCVLCITQIQTFLQTPCPIFITYEECLAPDPEIIESVSSYVAKWATKPAEATEQERQTIAKASKKIWDTEVSYPYKTAGGETLYIVDIFTDAWGGWYHGYLYVHDGHDLGTEWRGGTLTKIDDHWYIYNWND